MGSSRISSVSRELLEKDISLMIECMNSNGPTMIIDIPEASMLTMKKTRGTTDNCYDLSFIIPDDKYKQYHKPENNKQAVKLLHKR
jgi:hypothetical protein